ncbi:hypothetical protein EYF80_056145 [Liparis tanakae]|uniref:Uncharacterized protein n=1 Tax=Liparis tanakae TaxID=230148 RepID=A0A4Z2EXK1_9TELE|nr:hypothetical protein EYF80_056145 [Liparis tanakae]
MSSPAFSVVDMVTSSETREVFAVVTALYRLGEDPAAAGRVNVSASPYLSLRSLLLPLVDVRLLDVVDLGLHGLQLGKQLEDERRRQEAGWTSATFFSFLVLMSTSCCRELYVSFSSRVSSSRQSICCCISRSRRFWKNT